MNENDIYAAQNIYDAWDNGDRPAIRRKFARREELIRMAREAGFCVEQIDTFDEVFAPDDSYYTQHPNVGYEVLTGILERFAALVAAAEREECAKVCEEKQKYSMPIACPDGISGCLVAHYVPARRDKTGSECAAAIRARGQA